MKSAYFKFNLLIKTKDAGRFARLIHKNLSETISIILLQKYLLNPLNSEE